MNHPINHLMNHPINHLINHLLVDGVVHEVVDVGIQPYATNYSQFYGWIA